MVLTTDNKSIELTYSTRNVVKMLDALGTNDIKTIVFDGLNKMDIRRLAVVIQQLASPRTYTVSEIYDFIDEYKANHGCSIKEIYTDIINDLNDNYFFDRKMSPEELAEVVRNPLATSMDDVVTQAVKDAVGKIAAEAITAPLT